MKRRAFSLIELLVVVAILGILAVITLPALSSLTQSNDLLRGGQVLADHVNLARQMASAQNAVIEMRLIQLPGRSGYSGVQLWKSDGTNGMKSMRSLARLPESVAIMSNLPHAGALPSLPTGTMPSTPVATASAPYAALQIRPSGNVTPVMPMTNLFFTVVSAKAGGTERPANYFVLQINPLTGVPLVFRP